MMTERPVVGHARVLAKCQCDNVICTVLPLPMGAEQPSPAISDEKIYLDVLAISAFCVQVICDLVFIDISGEQFPAHQHLAYHASVN